MEVSVRYGNTCAAVRDCFASSTRAYLELCEVKDPSVKKEGSVVLSLSLYTGPSKDSRGRAQKRHRLVIGGVGVPELFLTGDTKVMLWTHTQVMLVVQIADFITLKIKPDKQSSGAGQSLQGWRDSMKKLENSVKKEETKLNKERTDALLDEAQHFPANRERALASFHLHRAALATAPTLKELKKNVLMEDPNDAMKLDRAKEYKSKKATAWVLPFSVWDPVTKIGKLGLALELYFSQVRTLDAETPPSRLGYILSDAAPRALLVDRQAAERLIRDGPPLTLALVALESGAVVPAAAALDAARPTYPASCTYLIYTSGSTAAPKAVLGSREGLLARCRHGWTSEPFADGEVCAQKTARAFIDSLWETLGPLGAGVPLLLLPPSLARS